MLKPLPLLPLLGGFLASEFILGELIWLDYLAGDFTLIGLIRR